MQPNGTQQGGAGMPAPKHGRRVKAPEGLESMNLEMYPYPASFVTLSKLFTPWAPQYFHLENRENNLRLSGLNEIIYVTLTVGNFYNV